MTNGIKTRYVISLVAYIFVVIYLFSILDNQDMWIVWYIAIPLGTLSHVVLPIITLIAYRILKRKDKKAKV